MQREFTVLSETDLRTPEQFNDLIVKEANGYLVRLDDVGHAELGPLDERRVVRFNGKPAIALGVIKQATANPLEVAQEVQAISCRPSPHHLPEGMQVRDGQRQVGVHRRVRSRTSTRPSARRFVLVVLIIFLFLRSIRATLIPLVTIPVSLIGAFALMYVFGFSINTLTLLALVLAIGLVVDDAIVMLENIYRHVEARHDAGEGGAAGQPGDQLRHHRHDHHAGRRVCADRLHDRRHRAAVHRIRLDARRRGDRLRLRGADPVADDVLEAASNHQSHAQSALSRSSSVC